MQCYSCKGKLKCGLKFCPMNKTYFKIVDKEEFDGSSPPAVFVGSKLYPDANVGILSPAERDENAWLYNSQKYWAEHNFDIKDVLALRSSLINSRFRVNIKDNSKFLGIAREIGVTLKPVDIEVQLKQKIKFKLNFDQINLPAGPTAKLKQLRITSNVKVPNQIDKAISDTDLKANEALMYLNKYYDEAVLTQLLSLGVLGIKNNRKLVPTRWSITAVDDSLAKNLMKEVKYYEILDNYQLFYGHYLGNYYIIMLFPEVFNYELFEGYMPGSAWNPDSDLKFMHDFESVFGRKTYAENTQGGYYATRLAILEKLKEDKKQASVLVLRFETPEYWASLGVWVVREAARKTLNNIAIEFENKEQMFDCVKNIVKKKFNFDINDILKRSKIIKNLNNQLKLKKWF